MNAAIRCMKLDLLLLKPYWKSMLLALIVPALFPLFTGSLYEGLSFAATLMAMTAGYTFSIAEKNSLDRFYGFLPATRSALVLGRYLTVFSTGFAALLLTLAAQAAILRAMSSLPPPSEVAGALLFCAALFCVYACVQIPGYYRFGSIKGKIFLFVPTVGFLLFYFLFKPFAQEAASPLFGFALPPALSAAAVAVAMALAAALSVAASIRIVKKKRC